MFGQVSLVVGAKLTHVRSTCIWATKRQRSTVNPVCPIGQPVSGTGGKIVKLLPIYINACRTPQSQADLNTISQDQLQRSPMKSL